MIYFNNFSAEYDLLKKEIDKSILKVLKKGWYILGKEVEEFEDELSHYIGVKNCIGVSSGTDAITLSLMALNIGKGDEVITTNMTAFPTVVGIIRSGAKPVLVDIQEEDGLINPSMIEKKITNKTRAIIPVHLFGQSCDMKKIKEIAILNNLEIIEDCAQSLGAEYDGDQTGTFGACGAFSFYPTKNLGAIGDAGAVVTNNAEIYNKLKMMRNYGQKTRYKHDIVGINSRLDEIQAAILRVKLNHANSFIEKRKEIAMFYRNNIDKKSYLKQLRVNNYGKHSYHLFVLKCEDRDDLLSYLSSKNIQALIHYPIPVNEQKAFPFQKNENFPNTVKFSKSVLSIPIHNYLKKKEVEKIANTINNFSI